MTCIQNICTILHFTFLLPPLAPPPPSCGYCDRRVRRGYIGVQDSLGSGIYSLPRSKAFNMQYLMNARPHCKINAVHEDCGYRSLSKLQMSNYLTSVNTRALLPLGLIVVTIVKALLLLFDKNKAT